MKITRNILVSLGACSESIEEWDDNNLGEIDLADLLHMLPDHRKKSWSFWLLVKLLRAKNPRLECDWSIYCAKLALPIWEKYSSDDKRLHDAIKAAEEYLDGKISKKKLETAVAPAKVASVSSFNDRPAEDTTVAVYMACNLAYANSDLAEDAAFPVYIACNPSYSGCDAAAYTYSAHDFNPEIYNQIINKALELLEINNNNIGEQLC